MKPVADANELTVTQTAEGDVRVATDLNMLSVVIRNLLVNAIQYVPPAGNVTIEILGGAAEVKVRIANTNASLNEDDLAHLFEPFWRKDFARTESNHQGLGLAIVQEYCRALGVQIEAGLDERKWFWVMTTIPRRQSREKRVDLAGRA
jgi:signal transduction histidine kinase